MAQVVSVAGAFAPARGSRGRRRMQRSPDKTLRRPRQFSVTLPDPLMAELHALAKRKAIAPATLARQWIAERLEVEREAARKGTQE